MGAMKDHMLDLQTFDEGYVGEEVEEELAIWEILQAYAEEVDRAGSQVDPHKLGRILCAWREMAVVYPAISRVLQAHYRQELRERIERFLDRVLPGMLAASKGPEKPDRGRVHQMATWFLNRYVHPHYLYDYQHYVWRTAETYDPRTELQRQFPQARPVDVQLTLKVIRETDSSWFCAPAPPSRLVAQFLRHAGLDGHQLW
jgi:hypothetical protein